MWLQILCALSSPTARYCQGPETTTEGARVGRHLAGTEAPHSPEAPFQRDRRAHRPHLAFTFTLTFLVFWVVFDLLTARFLVAVFFFVLAAALVLVLAFDLALAAVLDLDLDAVLAVAFLGALGANSKPCFPLSFSTNFALNGRP